MKRLDTIVLPDIFALVMASCCVAAAPATRPVAGTLLDTNGQPAKHATVVLIASGCSEDAKDGRVTVDADGQSTTTDESGRFAFGPTTRPAGSIVVVTPAGRAFALIDNCVEGHPLQLVPYSFVEGTVIVRGHIAGGEAVKGWSFPIDDDPSRETHGMFMWTVKADGAGHFRMPVIGGEDTAVGRDQPLKWTEDMPRTDRLSVPRAATVHQDVGGGGRLVTFHVNPPKGFTFESAQVYLIPRVTKIKAASPEWPADSIYWNKSRQEAFLNAWKSTDTARSALAEEAEYYRRRDSLYYLGGCDSDGRVRLEDTLPGHYMLMVRASGFDPAGVKKTLDYYQPAVVPSAPENEVDQPLTWPEVQLSFWHRLYPGDNAPDFDFAGFDGGRVKLTDHRGKLVLVHFWATWCGPCRGAMPYLKAIDDRFGNDPRFVSIHIAEDDTMPPAQRYITAEQIKGVQAWSGPSDESEVTRAYGGDAIPTVVLIGPDRTVLFVANRAEQLMPEVEKAIRAMK